MQKRRCVWLWLFAFSVICSAAQPSSGEQFVGTWTGTWEAPGSPGGGFDLTLEKGKDGPVTGGVSVTGEPTYKAAFKTVSFDGKKMTATYQFPPEPSIEVVLVCTFDGNSANGTWSARDKATGTEAGTGGWKVTRK